MFSSCCATVFIPSCAVPFTFFMALCRSLPSTLIISFSFEISFIVLVLSAVIIACLTRDCSYSYVAPSLTCGSASSFFFGLVYFFQLQNSHRTSVSDPCHFFFFFDDCLLLMYGLVFSFHSWGLLTSVSRSTYISVSLLTFFF